MRRRKVPKPEPSDDLLCVGVCLSVRVCVVPRMCLSDVRILLKFNPKVNIHKARLHIAKFSSGVHQIGPKTSSNIWYENRKTRMLVRCFNYSLCREGKQYSDPFYFVLKNIEYWLDLEVLLGVGLDL